MKADATRSQQAESFDDKYLLRISDKYPRQQMSAFHWNSNIVRNWVLYTEYSLWKTQTRSMSLSTFISKLTVFFPNIIKAENWCTYSNCLAEVPWVIRVLKWICTDQHHVQCYSAGPNISNLIFGTVLQVISLQLQDIKEYALVQEALPFHHILF